VVGPPDDLVAVAVAVGVVELGSLVDDGRPQGDVGQAGALGLMPSLSAAPAPRSRPQALGRQHADDAGVDGCADGLDAYPLGCILYDERLVPLNRVYCTRL